MSERRQKQLAKLSAALILAILAVYPLLGTLVTPTPFPSLVASIPSNGLAVLFTVALLRYLPAVRLQAMGVALVLFASFCLLRLAWDFAVVGLEGAGQTLPLFVVTLLMPALAILSVPAKVWDERRIALGLLVIGAATAVAALIIHGANLAGERVFYADSTRLAFEAVNPITLGHAGVSTLLAVFVLWDDPRRPRLPRAGLLIVAMLALSLTVATGARGPVVSLFVCLCLLALFQARWRLRVVILGMAMAPTAIVSDSTLVTRFTTAGIDPSSLERLQAQKNAIDQFLASPWVGNAYIETEMMMYPHNPVIESAMATGVIGLLLFTLLFGNTLLIALRRLRRGQLMMALLSIQYLVSSLLSGSIYASSALWLVMSQSRAERV
jgi:O-antigen ligase